MQWQQHFVVFFRPPLCVSAWLSRPTSKPSPVVSRVNGLAANLLRRKRYPRVGGSGHHLQGGSPPTGQSGVFANYFQINFEQTRTCVSVTRWLE